MAKEKSDVIQENVESFPVGIDDRYSFNCWMHLNFIGNCCYGSLFLFYDSGCVGFWGYRLSLSGLSPSVRSPLSLLQGKHLFHRFSFPCSAQLSSAHLRPAPPDLIETWSRCCLEIEKTEIRPYSPITTALIISASADVQ